MHIKILIVEDEALVAERLKRLASICLTEMEVPHTIEFASSVNNAENHLQTSETDLIFLDLNLHGEDGFTLLQKFSAKAAYTIVVSANTDRAIEAFDYGVLDFVAKPFTKDRMHQALSRLCFDREELAANPKRHANHISFEVLGNIEIVETQKLLYFKALDKYTEAITTDGRSLFHAKSINKLADLLGDSFIRTHRSYLVQVQKILNIKSLEGSKYLVVLTCGDTVPIGRTRIEHVRQLLESTLAKKSAAP